MSVNRKRVALRTPVPDRVGETTITGKNQVSLPTRGLRRLGWQRGDRLTVEVMNDNIMVLMRRPASWTDAFSGKMGDVFGAHDETIESLEEERREWDQWAERRGI